MSDATRDRKLEPLDPQPMVDWYSPGQLIHTGAMSLIAAIFGQQMDRRIIEALGTQADVFDCTRNSEGENLTEITIDYVADTGDGWNSTYAVAYWATRDLSLGGSKVPRGDILVFGGDEVYPTASRLEYARRLVAPYETALAYTDPPHPRVFAIPGNHDWYDNLVAFSRLFLNRRWFAGWQVPQERSYFVLQLPHGWWLVGTDIQLGQDIDFDQVEYFRKAAEKMGSGDRVVLCNAVPSWIYNGELSQAAGAQTASPEMIDQNLDFVTQAIFGGRVWVHLAGDLHHYRRHADKDGRQKITAGGGGAFLHPTHSMSELPLEGGFEPKASFPARNVSHCLTWHNLGFMLHHPGFGALLGTLYVLTAWSAMADLGVFGIREWPDALYLAVTAAFRSPVALFWGLALLAGTIFFTEARSALHRFCAGTVHGLAHLASAFGLGWGAGHLAHHYGFAYPGLRHLLLSGGVMFVGGWILGSLLFSFYLIISLNVFGRHRNEAFSSLSAEDWKSFLRLHIDQRGGLTIYPVGLRRVPRRWKQSGEDRRTARMAPDDPNATAPELIEDPIIIPPRGST
jgi:hypothetical protein